MTLPPRSFEGPVARDVLFEPYRLPGGRRLKNRILLSPCSRGKAAPDLTPSPGSAAYYAARATAGLVITEATVIDRRAQGFARTPGIFRDGHVARWAEVVEAVHRVDGLVFCQLWHTGRMGHSHWTGETPLAPSAVLDPAARRASAGLALYHQEPLAMREADIADAIAMYATAATNARHAGFDGIEIHAANGYLPEQFLRRHTNRRTDSWGGSPENRARFALAVVDACAAVFGAENVGIRLSPAAYFSEMRWREGDNEAYLALLAELHKRPIAYVHTGIVDDDPVPYLDGTSSAWLRRHWRGTLIGNGGYTPDAAAAHIAAGGFDLIAFGRDFIANADLVERVAARAPLRPYSRELLDSLE